MATDCYKGVTELFPLPWILKNNHSTYDSRTDAVRSGMVAVEQMLGTATGFYASESWMKTQFDGAGLMNEGYNAWVAHWGSSQGMGNVQMWQYSNAGSVPGISTGITMVFVPAVSTFVISRMLGGGSNLMIGDLIEMQFLGNSYNLNVGSAMSLVLMIIVLLCMSFTSSFDEDEMEGVS